jgi:hypothetical protein
MFKQTITKIALSVVTAVCALTFLVSCASTKKADSKTDAKAATASAKTKDSKATASKESGKAIGQVTCTSGTDNRILEIVGRGQAGCELTYTKFGEAKSIATSEANVGYCEEVQNRIKGNLTTAGFTCQ